MARKLTRPEMPVCTLFHVGGARNPRQLHCAAMHPPLPRWVELGPRPMLRNDRFAPRSKHDGAARDVAAVPSTDSCIATNDRAMIYSITSSARPRSVAGMSRPIAFAVLRLITRSNFVENCTGNSNDLGAAQDAVGIGCRPAPVAEAPARRP